MLEISVKKVIIPTYGVGEPDKNPMFLEKRVYQGSSGRVYPYPVIDKILDEKYDKEYEMVFLENDYIQVQVMPEIGGRIYRALDKTNGVDFVYYNKVIKPALVGLCGPWISGGIEFNWPQHHRPNTFGALDFSLDDTDPDSKTVWLTELDRMYGTKVTTGITLRHDSAAIAIHSELYNPTGENQTFLWWANPAVSAHDETRSIFPPDVCAVMDHGKRDTSRFPIATGVYYKMDYSSGVDISRYKNIPVPTSYMAYHSDYDFVGGYDYRAKAGVLHVADHHISPGKKQWTWGNGEFGQAWDRMLTDSDGPYIELMAGVFTDNQPDFTWLAPYECKQFTQYFLPYKEIGAVKNANTDLVIGLEVESKKAKVSVYAVRPLKNANLTLSGAKIYVNLNFELNAANVYKLEADIDTIDEELTLTVSGENFKSLSYTTIATGLVKTPSPAKAIGSPKSLPDNESLWLAGIHLEQYRHATYEPSLYYLEGLRRNPDDLRINNAYGSLLYRSADFTGALNCFKAAVATATRHSPNPIDGEAHYNLGKAYERLNDLDKAYSAYYKAAWSNAQKSAAYLMIGQIDARRGDYNKSLEHLYESLYSNYKNMKTRGAIAIVSRLLKKNAESDRIISETLGFDPLEPVSLYESKKATPKESHAAISLAQNYRDLGLYQEASIILEGAINACDNPYPMLMYYIADCHSKMGDDSYWTAAKEHRGAYCFPNSLKDHAVLQNAVEKNPSDAMAFYYLGCFFYDKKRHTKARDCFERCAALLPDFPTAYRNLALYYANKEGDYKKARALLEKAFSLNECDARIFYELCELYAKMAFGAKDFLNIMENKRELTLSRDDLAVLYANALLLNGKYEKVIDLLTNRRFHPWEGGEGKVPTLHIEARIGIAKKLISNGHYREAVEHLEKATIYYENFGEGKLMGAQENNIYYYLGVALSHIDKERAKQCLKKAATGLSEPTGAMYYNDQPPHMIYYQGLALKELGQTNAANSRFNKLIDYGEKHLNEPQTMDYFAVSLPDFLVFETDLDLKNNIHCYYMMGLGFKGLGNTKRADEAFEACLELAPNHYGALSHKEA